MPSLQDLQAAAIQIGQSQLRSLLLEHQSTLNRLPALRTEVEGWLRETDVDHERLAQRLEAPLKAAARWFVQHDLLDQAVRQQERLRFFQQTLEQKAVASNLAVLLEPAEREASLAEKEAQQQAKEEERRKQRQREETEALARKAEADRIKAEEKRRAAELAETKKRRAAEEAERQRQADIEANIARQQARAQRVAALGYMDNGNGTVTDRNTGLMWKQDLEGTFFWSQAVRKFGSPGATRYAGYGDWRLPTVAELKTLLRPAPDFLDEEVFPEAKVRTWTSSPYRGLFYIFLLLFSPLLLLGWLFGSEKINGESPDLSDMVGLAWRVNFSDGSVNNYYRNKAFAVRLVRASQ